MKEKAIGILFAAGTTLGVIGQLPALTVSFGVGSDSLRHPLHV